MEMLTTLVQKLKKMMELVITKGQFFWYGESTATNLTNDGVSSLSFKVDGELVGSTAANVYWVSQPECGENSSITVEKDLAGVKNKTYDYEVSSDNGTVIWSGSANFTANTCLALELSY